MGCEHLREPLLSRREGVPDMLTAKQTEALSGHGTTVINHWLKKRLVAGLNYYGTNLNTRESPAEHLASQRRAGDLSQVGDPSGIVG